jgi:hypothetical protein
MKRKSAKSEEMGGIQANNLHMRLADDLKTALADAAAIAPKTKMSEVVRISIEPYCEFAKVEKRRPHDFTELAKWHLARIEKQQ